MKEDRLYLLRPGFSDPQRADGPFVCPDSIAIEGQLAAFPDLAKRLAVTRLEYPRPRKAVIALVGEANQSLPLMIFGDAAPPPSDAQRHGGLAFTNDPKRIMDMLTERHGFPRMHH